MQELILTLRNRHIHKCDLSNLCNTLEINIEFGSIRNDGKKSDVDHCPQSPHIEYDETCNLGLVKGHYFINDYTELTSYSLDNYEEIKDIEDCNQICKELKFNGRYKRGNDIFIKAFQLLKMLMDNVDKLIAPMELTDGVLNTQFYDKVNDYKTLEYNFKNCILEEYVAKIKINMEYYLVLKPLPLSINTCLIYVGFTTVTYNKSL